MSEPAAAGGGFWERLPARLRPLETERPGLGNVRLIETTLLVLLGLILAVATVNDLARQVGTNHRLIADLRTWRVYTGHENFKNIGIEQQIFGVGSTRDVVCANTLAGPPDTKPQLCLLLAGPVTEGRRQVLGGWYVPPYVRHNDYQYRYGCFGAATKGLCAR